MLKDLKIRTKLFLMVAAPVIGMLIFSLWNVKDQYRLLQGLVQTERLTGLGATASEEMSSTSMIKAIQNETSGAVGSMELGVREVEKGMESSRKSGEALVNILSAINEVTMQIHQIATAAEEQTAVTGEISTNIHLINEVVLQTAQGAHQTAGAATHLSTLACELQQIVGRSKLA